MWVAQCCLRSLVEPRGMSVRVRSRGDGARQAHCYLSLVFEGALVLRSRSLVGLSQPSDARRAKFSQHDSPEVHFETQGGAWCGGGTGRKHDMAAFTVALGC
jgi:hypothetical protein